MIRKTDILLGMLKVEIFPALQDNYIFLFEDPETQKIAVVDPSVSAPVVDWLSREEKSLDYILNTHHHWDHVGGNSELKSKYDCKVLAGNYDKDRIEKLDCTLKQGDSVDVGSLSFDVLEIPGHTLGHIAYYSESEKILFCGDTLFSIGCGRLFEGSPAQMFESLQKLKNLPEDTRVFCAHEYTEENIRFALSLHPDSGALQHYRQSVIEKRKSNKPSIPSSLKLERQLNPFLLADSPEEFAAIRAAKDKF